jgi:hypothetical protein
MNYDELRVRYLTSRMGGNRLQQRFVELIWTAESDELLHSRLPELMDNLDEMTDESLKSVVAFLERDGNHNNAIGVRARSKAITNASNGELDLWVHLMDRHFSRLRADDWVHELADESLLTAVDAVLGYYRSGVVTDLTPEQEWALFTFTVTAMDDRNTGLRQVVKSRLSGLKRRIYDEDMIAYAISNTDKTDEIILTINEQGITTAAQLEAYFAGNHTALLEGSL